jgi:signal transduction histidine kinase/response regulator of citrate/malate metabolism
MAAFCIYLNAKNKSELSNTIFLHTLIAGIFFYYMFLGADSGINVLLIAVVAGVYTIFGSRHLDQIIYYFSICIVTYFTMILTADFNFFPSVVLDENYVSLIKITSFIVSAFACVLIPVMFDIENKEREKKLNVSKIKTEKLLEKKTTFFSMMSHEIRTPLHGIIGLADLLAENKSLPEGVKEKLNVINFSARNLKNIVSDVLDYSKLEDGRLTISKHSFNLHNLIKDIDSVQSMRVKKKGLTFKKRIAAGLPEFVDSDPFRLTQVLNNLIDNAIKFTDRGSVSLHAQFKETGTDKGVLQLEVVDTGIGIPEEFQNDLFTAYSQVSPSASRNFNGTGLGLAICKQIIHQLGGEIFLESTDQKGTLIKITLPVSVFHPEVAEEKKLDIDEKGLYGLRVLQVEDNLINQFVCEEVFKSLGVIYTIVDDGKKAIEKMKSGAFDLIIMDYHMPSLSGFEVSSIIRKNENEAHKSATPILIATADSEGSKKENYTEHGINGHIIKPFSKSELLETLLYYCKELNIEINQTKLASYFDHIHFDGPQINMDFIREIVGNDDETVKELVTMVRESVPKYIEVINNYKIIGVNTELERKDFITQVHNLKSNFRNVGADNFSMILQVAEDCLREEKNEAIVWEAIALVEGNLHLFKIPENDHSLS